MFELRDYQREAVDRTLTYFRKTSAPGVLVLPTGAGKSLVIAALAKLARYRILVLAHVKELVEQNYLKFCQYCDDQDVSASIFSAGLNEKNASEKVVFASIQSAAVNLAAFEDHFSLVIIDECHRVPWQAEDNQTSQYQVLLSHLKQFNSQLKILGLTATPYRLDTGWIYKHHLIEKRSHPVTKAFFESCIYELPMKQLIDQGYLTPLSLLDAPVAFYDFDQIQSVNDWQVVINKAKRATPKIIDQVLSLSQSRQGVMIFAATVEHAKEIYQLLPSENSAIIIGSMNQKARDSVVNAFKQKQIKYLVNVSVLTTGFDAPHVDTIAILRPTQSVGLYQQMVGRGLRLSNAKTECLVLDYAANGYDIFRPEIGTEKPDSDSTIVDVLCPSCGHNNQFWGKVDSDGDIIEHYGRRCQGMLSDPEDVSSFELCDFRFRFKECPNCNAENDIAARHCHQCQHRLIDPDDQLKQALNLAHCKVIRCAGLSFQVHITKNNNQRLKVIYHDEQGEELSEFYALDTQSQRWAFDHYFVRAHTKNPGQAFSFKTIEDILSQVKCFRAPDFVIAHKDKKKGPNFWKISQKIFDYQGRYRKANEL